MRQATLLIADTDNQRIRKVFTDGTIRTVAGGGANYVDGVLAHSMPFDMKGQASCEDKSASTMTV
jgi:hypothetical protein